MVDFMVVLLRKNNMDATVVVKVAGVEPAPQEESTKNFLLATHHSIHVVPAHRTHIIRCVPVANDYTQTTAYCHFANQRIFLGAS